MANRIRVLVLTATNLKTSTGSMNTVQNLLDNLDAKKYTISIGLLDDLIPKRLMISKKELSKDPTYVPPEKIIGHPKVSKVYKIGNLTVSEMKGLFDVAIVAIYNEFGEDGKTLGLLELADIPYLSPGLKSSAVSFDKSFAKALLQNSGIPTSKSVEINKSFALDKISKMAKIVSYPLIVKPTSNGASRGTTLVKNYANLVKAVEAAFAFSDEVLLEKFIEGQEFTVGVIGHYTKPEALPPVLIKPKNTFFDYQSKYVKGHAEEICPAPITRQTESRLKKMAIKTYQAVKADNHARIDMILKGNEIYVLEINSFPGLIAASLFPKELKAAGISLSDFLDTSIRNKLLSKKS